MNFANLRRLLMGGTWQAEHLKDVDLRAARGFTSTWTSCIFENCNLDASAFFKSKFVGCCFKNCSMQNIDLSGSHFVQCIFEECDLVQANLMFSTHDVTWFLKCRMEYSSFLDASVYNARFMDCRMIGTNLLYAQSGEIDYRGSDLYNCKMAFGCLSFLKATYDEKQWMLFQCLVGLTKGVQRLQAPVMEIVRPAIKRLVDGYVVANSLETH